MLQATTGLLASLFSSRHSSKRLSRRAKVLRSRRMGVEELEARRLLVSRVWIDFGDAFPRQDLDDANYPGLRVLTSVTQDDLQTSLVGGGSINQVTGLGQTYFNYTGLFTPGSTDQHSVDLMSFADLVTSFSSVGVPADAATLETAIMTQIKRALEPYDIQVIPVDGQILLTSQFTYPTTSLDEASDLLSSNNLASDAASTPGNIFSTVPQYGSDDVYLYIVGEFFIDDNDTVQAALVPISTEFSVTVASPGSKPNRNDTGTLIDANYWIDRVLGPGGTGGYVNVAIGNASLYGIGWGFGLSEVENGTDGLYTNFFDPNVALINQSNAMVEAGFTENFLVPFGINLPINDQNSTYFPRFPMMQDGTDFQPLLRAPTLGNFPVLNIPAFPLSPLSPSQPPFFLPPAGTINTDPLVTANTYNQLVNDSDIGPNPDVAYVSGTGAFDQITITKLNAAQAFVLVNAFTDDTYTTLATDELGNIASFSYVINLSKIVIPGRKDSGQPFRIIVEGATNDDQIYLDPTLGVNVVVHGGPSVKFLQLTGNGAYNAQFTPASPPALANPSVVAARLIAEGLIPGATGTLVITGSTSAVVNKKTVLTPFTTTISIDHFNPANSSAVRLDGFNQLTVKSPGFLNNDIVVSSPSPGFWSIGGQVDSPFFTPSLFGALQIVNVKQLDINTTLGASNDTVTFATGGALPTGLQSVTVELGTGIDALNIDDSAVADALNYAITPTLLQYIPVVGPLFQGFTGISYSGAESVSVTGTQGNNNFVVSPSLTTGFFIDGQDPPPGTLPPDGDTLSVRLNGTTGAVNTPGAPGDGDISFTSAHQPIAYSNIELFEPPPDATVAPTVWLAVGAGPGGSSKPLVKVYDAASHTLLLQFYAFATPFTGGVQVVAAEVTGDGIPDIIVAPNAGRAGEVEVFDGALLAGLVVNPLIPISNATAVAGARIADFFPDPAGAAYKNGLFIAVGDVDGDGDGDIATSRARGVPLVRTWLNDGTGTSFAFSGISFNPYTAKFVTGAQVAAADVDADGDADIITAPGAGQIATVKIFDGPTASFIGQFNAFPNTFKGGVSLAAGDVDADGKAEIIVGAGAGGGAVVKVFDAGQGILLKQFQAYTTSPTAPVRVAVHDVVYGGNSDTGVHAVSIYTGQGISGATHDIRVFEPLSGAQVDSFLETAIDMKGGVNLG